MLQINALESGVLNMYIIIPGRMSPAIFMHQILFSSYYISITLMVSLWVNMAGKVVPGLKLYSISILFRGNTSLAC